MWAPTAGTEHITALKKVQVQQISCGYDHCIAFVAEDAGLGVPPVLCEKMKKLLRKLKKLKLKLLRKLKNLWQKTIHLLSATKRRLLKQ